MTDFFRFFAIQFLNYGVMCWNYRSVALVNYPHIAFSDVAAAAISFTLIRHVARTDSRVAMAGFILGGVCGSLVFTWLTTKVL